MGIPAPLEELAHNPEAHDYRGFVESLQRASACAGLAEAHACFTNAMGALTVQERVQVMHHPEPSELDTPAMKNAKRAWAELSAIGYGVIDLR